MLGLLGGARVDFPLGLRSVAAQVAGRLLGTDGAVAISIGAKAKEPRALWPPPALNEQNRAAVQRQRVLDMSLRCGRPEGPRQAVSQGGLVP